MKAERCAGEPEPPKELDVRRIADNPKVLEAFYREHLPAVTRYVTSRAGDPHSAADLISMTFLAAVESAHRYSSARGNPEAWLIGIAVRVVKNEHRRRSRYWRALRRVGGRRELDSDSFEALEREIDAARVRSHLRGAIQALPPIDRALLHLTAVDNATIADAARQVGIEPGAARVRLHRAKRRIRDALPDVTPHPGATP